MTVPLLRVCVHCGYPTPGPHARSCRDANSGVVEVVKPVPPAELDTLRTENERLREQVRKAELVLAVAGQGIDPEGYYAGTPGAELRRILAENERLRQEWSDADAVVQAARAHAAADFFSRQATYLTLRAAVDALNAATSPATREREGA